MSDSEKAVREAAENFHKALTVAKAAGLAVTWPVTTDGLLSISISETGKSAVPLTDVQRSVIDGTFAVRSATPEEQAAVKGKLPKS